MELPGGRLLGLAVAAALAQHLGLRRKAAREAAEQVEAEHAAVTELQRQLGFEREGKEAAQAALAVAQRDAAQQKAERATVAELQRQQVEAERAAVAELQRQLGFEREGKEAAQAALAVARRDAAQLEAERAAVAELRRQLACERERKEAVQSALAVAQRDAVQLKGECDELRARVGQMADKLTERLLEEEQVLELREVVAVLNGELAKAEAAAAPPCGAVARYYNRYADSTKARTPAQVATVLRKLLLACAEIHGAGPESEFLHMHKKLMELANNRVRDLKRERVDYGRLPEVEVRVAFMWSAGPEGCATYKGEPFELSAWINLVLVHRDSDRPLKQALPFVRTLNGLCVTAPRGGDGSAAPGRRWPGKEMDAVWDEIGRNDWKLFRGSGMSAEHKGWFVPGLVFRQPRYLATSLKLDQARDFAQKRAKDGRIPVIWVVLIDEERKCFHVNHLARYSQFREEAELLFPPCSVFTVRAVDWAEAGSGRISCITIEAAADNKEYPLDLPEAPWS